MNEDDSRSDPHSEAGIFHNQTTQHSGAEDGPDMLTGATRKSYTVPPVHIQESRKNHSTSQPQFRTENTPATIEADQILLVLQQLANNNNSVNFHNNINRISNLPKSLTTTVVEVGVDQLGGGGRPYVLR